MTMISNDRTREIEEANKRFMMNTLERERGYRNVRMLKDGTIIGTDELITSTALYIGLTPYDWDMRYTFTDPEALEIALKTITFADDDIEGYDSFKDCRRSKAAQPAAALATSSVDAVSSYYIY